MNTYRSTQEFAADAADRRALVAYVAGLPEAERIAYYYANPGFMLYGHPAYLLHEAGQLDKQDKRKEAVELLRRDTEQRDAAKYAEHRAAIAPGTADRVGASIAGTLGPIVLGGVGVVGSLAAGAPHLAAGVAAVFGCFAALGAISGAVAGQ